MNRAQSRRIWTVDEAKARLPELLRLAETEGPQVIGARKPFIVQPERLPQSKQAPQSKPLGKWLIENAPRGANLDTPRDRHSKRPIPFVDTDAR